MPRDAAQEPDALTMWFTRQRKAWWKKWRWVVIVVVSLRVVWLLIEIAPYAYAGLNEEISSVPWCLAAINWMLQVSQVEPYSTYLIFGIALLLGVVASKATIPSAEVALTQSTFRIFVLYSKFSRQRLWLWILLLYTIPEVANYAFRIIMEARVSVAFINEESILHLSYYFIISYLLVEAQAFTLRITAGKLGFSWLLLLPILIVIAVLQLIHLIWLVIRSTYSSYGSEVYYAAVWLQIGYSILFIAAAIILAYSKRKPPKGFTGTYET
jgi:hypothetical protein